MRRGIAALGMVVLFLGVPRDAAPANPPSRPLEVIGVLSRGSPAAWSGLDKLVSSAGAPASGTIEAVMWQGLAGGLGVPALSGVDTSGPVYAIYADDGQTRGMVLVVRVSDAPALAKSTEGLALEPRGKWATIGPKPLVDLVAPGRCGRWSRRRRRPGSW